MREPGRRLWIANRPRLFERIVRCTAATLAAGRRRDAAHGRPRRSRRRVEPAVPRAARARLPLHDWTATVTHCGRICCKGQKVNLSHAFAGQKGMS